MVLVCECKYFEVIGILIVNIMNITILIHYTLMCFAFCLELVFTLLKKNFVYWDSWDLSVKTLFSIFRFTQNDYDIDSQIERTWYQVTNRKNMISSHKSKELDIESQIERTWYRVTNRKNLISSHKSKELDVESQIAILSNFLIILKLKLSLALKY